VISYHSLFPPRSLWSGRLSRRDQDLSESRCRLSWCISSKLASGATVRSIVACNVGNLLVAKICEPGFKLSKHQSLRLRMLHYRTSLGRLRRGANSGSFAHFLRGASFPGYDLVYRHGTLERAERYTTRDMGTQRNSACARHEHAIQLQFARVARLGGDIRRPSNTRRPGQRAPAPSSCR
jgi:hypothetical protein